MGQAGWTRYIQSLSTGAALDLRFWVPRDSVSQKQIESLTTSR